MKNYFAHYTTHLILTAQHYKFKLNLLLFRLAFYLNILPKRSMLENKEEFFETEKKHSDFYTMDIIHQLAQLIIKDGYSKN